MKLVYNRFWYNERSQPVFMNAFALLNIWFYDSKANYLHDTKHVWIASRGNTYQQEDGPLF